MFMNKTDDIFGLIENVCTASSNFHWYEKEKQYFRQIAFLVIQSVDSLKAN